jgi:glycerol-3-phosphate dehydrogenase
MWAGTKLYDIVAGSHRFVPSAHFISADEAKQQFPMLKADGLKGGIVYYDGRHNDTRMNLMIALTAAQEGAAIGNYIAVESILKDSDGHAKGVSVRDVETGRTFKINAKSVVNATGCFGDNIRLLDNPSTTPLILGAAGVHVILPDHFSPDRMGLIIPKTRDGRVLFLLPWEGSTIAGTTDSPCDITMDPKATADDISFIISEANNFLSRPIKRSDVKAAWSGIRPLIKDPKKLAAGGKSSQLTRSHIVETSPSGMVSILGGKWTTYRRMAQDAVDELAKSIKDLPPTGPSITQHRQLLGADRAGVVVHRRYDRIAITLRETYGFDKEVANHLVANYGTRALQVAEIAKGSPTLFERISQRYPFIKAEVVFAADHEYARTITDILARRTRLGFLNADEAQRAIPVVADLMTTRLGWSSSKRTAEIAAATKFLEGMR